LTATAASRRELGLLFALTAVVVVVLWLVDTQPFAIPGTIDPWVYTALSANFSLTYHWFGATYYAARLPQLIPGIELNRILTPTEAYLVVHVVLYLAGAVFVYLLARRLFGVAVALVVYPVFLTNVVYVDSHTWDYSDGFVITYLAGGLYFLLSSVGSTSWLRPLLAGIFLAAAATTNLFATLLIFGSVIAYLGGRVLVEGRGSPRRVLRDALWFAVGAVILLAFCGWFAWRHGGRFLFFMTSIDALRAIDTASYKLPSYDWIWAEPRLLVPLFIAALVAIVWRRGLAADVSVVGLWVACVYVAIFVMLAIWEFAFSGTFLQIYYYFDTLHPLLFVAFGWVLYMLGTRSRLADRKTIAWSALLGLVAGIAPLVTIYGFDRGDLYGEHGSVVTLALMALTLISAIVLRVVPQRRAVFLAPLVAALMILSVNYASAANTTTYGSFETHITHAPSYGSVPTHTSDLADADDVFAVGVQLMSFLQRSGAHESLPSFWYAASADPVLTSLQSLYFYEYTSLGRDMPKIDQAFRERVRQLRPQRVVLLCMKPTCRNAADAMWSAGYHVSPTAGTRLHAGNTSVWARLYALSGELP
jgi:hypothetical protein